MTDDTLFSEDIYQKKTKNRSSSRERWVTMEVHENLHIKTQAWIEIQFNGGTLTQWGSTSVTVIIMCMKHVGPLPLQSCSSSLHKLHWWRVVHSHLHFGHSCRCEWQSKKKKRQHESAEIRRREIWAPTHDTFLRWWWDDAAVEGLLDRQLLIKTQEVAETPPHGESFTPEHGQRRLVVHRKQKT